jgi:DNA polymerase-3 subunit delta'
MALKDVIGQDRAMSILLRTLERGRVPSAYLFAGESGIGKKFAALNLAKALNCLERGAEQESFPNHGPRATSRELDDACDTCSSCKKIDAMTHPDFVMITPEKGEIRVGEVRAVEEALSFKPFEGRRKVVIMDDADAMNPSAANAFLKTLEEPPDESLLILITAHPDGLPETIRSRCCRINFVPLSPEACGKVIRGVLTKGKKGEEGLKRGVSLLIRLSMGRPGLAISSDIEKERERFIRLLESMLHGDNEIWADREEMERWLDMAFLLLRDMAALKVTEGTCTESSSPERAGCDDLLLNSDIKDFVLKMTKTTDIRDIINIYNKMVFLKGQMGFNLNKAITWNYTAAVVRSVMGNR